MKWLMRAWLLVGLVLVGAAPAHARIVRLKCRDVGTPTRAQPTVCPLDAPGDGVCSFAFCPDLATALGCPRCLIPVTICTQPDEGERYSVPIETKLRLDLPGTRVVIKCR